MNKLEQVVIAIRDSFNSNDIDCYPIAKAAIAAMREPTEEMLLAPGRPYGGRMTQDDELLLRKKAWQTMIDEALK